MSNSTITASGSLPRESEMESSPQHPSLETFVSFWSPVQLSSIEDLQTWLRQDGPANPIPQSESAKAMPTSAKAGPSLSKQFARLDPSGFWVKTSGGYCQPTLDGTLQEFKEIWPKAGMTVAGVSYRLRRWERRIAEIDSGLWPTVRANEHGDYQYDRGDHSKPRPTLTGAVKMFPTPVVPNGGRQHNLDNLTLEGNTLEESVKFATPQARDYRTGSAKRWEDARKGIKSCNLNDQVGGKLNPDWVDWLMGFPIGWADLKPLAMDKFRQWCEQHGVCLRKD